MLGTLALPPPPAPRIRYPRCIGPHCTRTPCPCWHLVDIEAHMVGKRAIHIVLERFLITIFKHFLARRTFIKEASTCTNLLLGQWITRNYSVDAVKTPKMCISFKRHFVLICAPKTLQTYRLNGRFTVILTKNNSKKLEQSFNSSFVTSTENSITTHKSIGEQVVLWMHLDKRYVSLNGLIRLITSPRTSSVFKVLTVMRNLYQMVLPFITYQRYHPREQNLEETTQRNVMIAIFFSF